MNKLELRGVIVPSMYDQTAFSDYITRGIITPESRFRTALAAMDKTQPLSVYINSPGGSVFSGNEMINALNSWTKETGQAIEITVGAIAASMAAAMTVNTNAVKIKAHKNSKIMFHGAMTDTEGGAQAHADSAALLQKINNDLKATLVSRYKLSPEKVDQWFAEGRAGWLTAEEAMKAGMISEIIDATDKPYKMDVSTSKMLSERGLKIAAILESEIIDVEDKKDEGGDKPSANQDSAIPQAVEIPAITNAGITTEETGTGDKPVTETKSADVLALTDALLKVQADNKKLEDEKAQAEKNLTERSKMYEAEKAKLIEQGRTWQGDCDRMKAAHQKEITSIKTIHGEEITKLANNISERDSKISGLESRLSKLTLTALELHPESVVADWSGAMKACNGDYVQARKQYPQIYTETIKNANKKKEMK